MWQGSHNGLKAREAEAIPPARPRRLCASCGAYGIEHQPTKRHPPARLPARRTTASRTSRLRRPQTARRSRVRPQPPAPPTHVICRGCYFQVVRSPKRNAGESPGKSARRILVCEMLVQQLAALCEPGVIRKGEQHGWKPSSNSDFSIRAFRAYLLVEIRQTVPCRAIRVKTISVNSTLPPS